MRRIAYLIFTAMLALQAGALRPEEVTNVQLADSTRYVTDMAGVLSAETISQADALLADIRRQTSAEVVAVVVPDLSGENEDDFATRLFSLWGVGKSDLDNGVVVLISTGDRRATIRTGYGAEGVLPDVIASRIIRGDMAPHFSEGDYNGGLLAALQTIHTTMTDPAARQELLSAEPDNRGSDPDPFDVYLLICCIAGLIAFAVVGVAILNARSKPTSKAYESMQKVKLGLLVASVFFLFFPLPAFLILVAMMRHVRLHKRLCPNCGTRLERVDEDNDNLYLTPSQDAEERLDSVDYDVWLCPDCGETDIIPYINPSKNYTVCPKCNTRACTLVEKRIVQKPTERRRGRGVDVRRCLHCGATYEKPFSIEPLGGSGVAVIPGLGGHGGGSFGGGGGFGGGGFGGGMTGGGGASGGW